MTIKMPQTTTSGNFLCPLSVRLREILIRYRTDEHVANIDDLLAKCPNADEAVLQWARANVANVSLGHEIQLELGADDPVVYEHRTRIQRENRWRRDSALRNARRGPYQVPSG